MSIYTATELEQGEKNPALLRTGTLSHVKMRKLATQGASGSTERLLTTIHASKLGQSWGEKGTWGIPTFLRSGYLLMCWQVVYIWEVGARMCGGNIWIFVKKNKHCVDEEVGAPKGLLHSRSERECHSPARLPCHHKTFLAAIS